MKTCEEISNAFDVLWNNIASNEAPGLNAYEKSVFLTKAQNELVKNHFIATSDGNSTGRGFDESAIRQMDFSTLLSSAVLQPLKEDPALDYRALVYKLPEEAMILINEQMVLSKSQEDTTHGLRQVIPLSYQEYMRLMSKPYKWPLKWQAWRLMADGSSDKGISSIKVEIVLNRPDFVEYPLRGYALRYVRKPVPIVLEDMSSYGEDYAIEGVQKKTMCELDSSIHDAIIQRAVELAKLAWGTGSDEVQLQMASGKRSE